MKKTINNRNPLIDIARIIALFAIVMVHCSAPFVRLYNVFSEEFVCGNVFDSISRMGVPLFIMISGALFLDERKNLTIKGIFLKNIKNIAVITIIWSVIYSALYHFVFYLEGNTNDLKDIITDIILGHYHMWYLYMTVGLYIITPFLKKFVTKDNGKMVLFFIICSFFSQFLLSTADKILIRYRGIDLIGKWVDKFNLEFFGGYIAFFLVGWYITHIGIKRKSLRCVIYILAIFSILFIFFYSHFTGDYKTAYDKLGAPVFVYSTGLFLAINNIKIGFKEKITQILAKISDLTFGVYIIHIIILSIFTDFILPYTENCAIYIIVSFVTVICVSFIASYIISKIPVIKKLIRA